MRSCLIVLFLTCLACAERPGDGANVPWAPRRVLIQPLGQVAPAHVDSVAAALTHEHHVIATIGSPRELPPEAFINTRSPRYRADTLIAWLRGIKPDGVDHIIGITAKDISITKYAADGSIKEPASKYRDFGIFGLGYIGGPSCVVSTFRLGDGRSGLFFDRLMKITVHELGHNRALPHCPDPACVMRDAVEHIASIDAAERSFCGACRARLSQPP